MNADRLLIVTFTNAAAAEMRSRIEKRLDEECRKNSNNIGLIYFSPLLYASKIINKHNATKATVGIQ